MQSLLKTLVQLCKEPLSVAPSFFFFCFFFGGPKLTLVRYSDLTGGKRCLSQQPLNFGGRDAGHQLAAFLRLRQGQAQTGLEDAEDFVGEVGADFVICCAANFGAVNREHKYQSDPFGCLLRSFCILSMILIGL